MTETEKFAQEVGTYLEDLLNAERFLWFALIGELEKKNIVTKHQFAATLEFMTSKMKELSPNHPLGDNRFDTKLLEEIASLLQMKPGQEPKPPSWTPRIIQGGKREG